MRSYATDRKGIIPHTISFKGTLQQLDSFADKIAHASRAVRIRLLDELLRAIAYHRIGTGQGGRNHELSNDARNPIHDRVTQGVKHVSLYKLERFSIV